MSARDLFRMMILAGIAAWGVAVEPAVVSADQGDECCRCHEAVCREIDTSPFVHRPALEKQCVGCHLDPAKSQGRAVNDHVVPDFGAMKWVARSVDLEKEHWLRLEKSRAGKKFAVRVEDAQGKARQEVVEAPPWEAVADFPDDGEAPRIESPMVAEVRRGVLTSATIRWRTSKPATSQVRYGEGSLDTRTAEDRRLKRNYRVVLSGLKPGVEYRVQPVSRDVAGREGTTSPLSFSTATPMEAASENDAAAGQGELTFSHSWHRFRDHIFFRVTTGRPVTVRVAVLPEPDRREQARKTGERHGGPSRSDHPALVDPAVLAITGCFRCHPETKGIMSHPVNVFPKGGMVIPYGYSTLPDGRISCMSCHLPHAATNRYRLPKGSKKELCLGCHRNFR